MKTVTMQAFCISELSGSAKTNALAEVLRIYDGDTSLIYEEASETVKAFCEATGAKTSNRSWLEFERMISYRPHEDDLVGIRLRTWVINNWYALLFERKAYKSKKRVRFSRIAKVKAECPFTGTLYDDVMLEPIRKFVSDFRGSDKCPHATDIRDLMNRCFSALGDCILNDVEYVQSDEYLTSLADMHELNFDKNGKILEI